MMLKKEIDGRQGPSARMPSNTVTIRHQRSPQRIATQRHHSRALGCLQRTWCNAPCSSHPHVLTQPTCSKPKLSSFHACAYDVVHVQTRPCGFSALSLSLSRSEASADVTVKSIGTWLTLSVPLVMNGTFHLTDAGTILLACLDL